MDVVDFFFFLTFANRNKKMEQTEYITIQNASRKVLLTMICRNSISIAKAAGADDAMLQYIADQLEINKALA